MPDPPISLFISYAHADSAFVDRLEADLQKEGFDPWVDRQRLKGGQRWRRELQDAVKRAQVLLIVLSPDAVASQNVQIEYDYMLELGRVVIPLYYRQCEVPMELRAIQWIDFRHSYDAGLAALVQVLHQQQDQATPTPPAAQTHPGDLVHPPVQKEPAETGHPPFNNLPAQLTPLIGREQELQAVSALMHEPEVRLVTLLGPGGVGKTRLGLAVAQSIAEICVQLDGLPLAIELAAARIKLLPPKALLKRLSQRFELLTGGAQNLPSRQQTLHNTLQWSYDLLTQEEQRLFRRLCVFVGGCTLEAAEAVCQREGQQGMEVLEGVSLLLDKSLLQQTAQEDEEPRLLLLETIREYGQERLQATGELAAAKQAHASYYLQLAEEAEPQLQGPEQVTCQERLEREQQNLRAAIQWALSSGQPAWALRISSAVWVFWFRIGYPREVSALMEHVLAGSAAAPAPLRAKALLAAGTLAFDMQDFHRYRQLIEASQPLVQELGDRQGIAIVQIGQGIIALQRHPEAAVWTQLEESLADLRKHGDPWWITGWLLALGRQALMLGDVPRSLELLGEGLARARAAGDPSWEAWALLSLGQLALTQGDLATAQQRLEEGLSVSRRTRDKTTILPALTLQGWIRWRQGKTDEARAAFQEGVRFCRELGYRPGIFRLLLPLGHIAVGEGNMAEARANYAESLAIVHDLQVEGFTATGLKGLGVVAAAEGQLAPAARLWGAAGMLRESQDVSLPAALYEPAVQAARTQLGEQAFAAAWAEGRTMKLEQVIDDALKLRDEAGKQ